MNEPASDSEEWLLETMAALVRRSDPTPFLSAPLLEANEEHFPDTYDDDVVGVRTLVRRVLRHAGLGDLHVDLEVIPDSTVDESSTPVIFRSLDHESAAFELHGPPPPWDELVGHLVFEAGHAHRASQSLDTDEAPYRDRVDADDDVVDQRAAVTAAYLGFGIIAANAAHRYESKSPSRDLVTHADYAHKSAGSLSPDALAWLLALQVVVRGQGDKSVRAALAPNQRAAFKAAVDALTPRRDELVEALGLPDAAEWPEPQSLDLEELTVEDADVELYEREAEREEKTKRKRKGATVYRVDTTRPWAQVIIVAIIAGGIVGPVTHAVTGVGVIGWIAQIVVTVLVAVWLRGPRPDECSDTGCRAELPANAESCPSCGARIVAAED